MVELVPTSPVYDVSFATIRNSIEYACQFGLKNITRFHKLKLIQNKAVRALDIASLLQ